MVRTGGRLTWWWGMLLLVAALDAVAGCGSSARVGPIEIRGSDEVVAQTQAALSLLEERAPDAYQKAQDQIGLIAEGSRSEMYVDAQPATLRIARETALRSLTWYAAVIAHEAMHCEVCEGRAGASAMAEMERACIDYMMDVAVRIGAPPDEIAALAAEDGTHNDADDDGDADWIDWLANDW